MLDPTDSIIIFFLFRLGLFLSAVVIYEVYPSYRSGTPYCSSSSSSSSLIRDGLYLSSYPSSVSTLNQNYFLCCSVTCIYSFSFNISSVALYSLVFKGSSPLQLNSISPRTSCFYFLNSLVSRWDTLNIWPSLFAILSLLFSKAVRGSQSIQQIIENSPKTKERGIIPERICITTQYQLAKAIIESRKSFSPLASFSSIQLLPSSGKKEEAREQLKVRFVIV